MRGGSEKGKGLSPQKGEERKKKEQRSISFRKRNGRKSTNYSHKERGKGKNEGNTSKRVFYS